MWPAYIIALVTGPRLDGQSPDLVKSGAMKTVSVILPNYNHARWLSASLSALAAQADDSVEIIVVDDGSTDASVALVERLACTCPFIRLVRHETNRGLAAAMATGLAAAEGEFLLFSAADDLVLPGLLETAVMALRSRPEAAFFCSQVVIIDPQNRIAGYRPATFPRSTAGYVSPAELRRAMRGTDNWFVGTSVIYRRAHLEAVGYFDHSLGSLADGMTNRRLAFRCGFWFDPKILSAWRRYPESMSGQVAMSAAAGDQSLATAHAYLTRYLPDDVREEYAELFDRRYRFNIARLRLLWNKGAVDARDLARLLKLSAFDRRAIEVLGRVPVLGTRLVLVWLTLRLHPFSMRALAASWWRNATVNRAERSKLQAILDRSMA